VCREASVELGRVEGGFWVGQVGRQIDSAVIFLGFFFLNLYFFISFDKLNQGYT
jgi:hypothetical protein